jgi:hypothetical protein
MCLALVTHGLWVALLQLVQASQFSCRYYWDLALRVDVLAQPTDPAKWAITFSVLCPHDSNFRWTLHAFMMLLTQYD